MDERERVLAAADGEPEARAWVARTWTPPIYRFCLRMLDNPEDARDVTQDAVVRLINALDRYDPARPFAAWAFSIARNACIDQLRRRGRGRWDGDIDVADLPDIADDAVELSDRAGRAAALQDALAALPPMYREALVLYHFEHMKHAEIAEILDIPVGTVMNRIFRARQKVKTLLDERGIGP